MTCQKLPLRRPIVAAGAVIATAGGHEQSDRNHTREWSLS
jgi:hypothetical protein